MLPGKIDRKELRKKIDRGDDFTLVDARSVLSYREEHIKGAISLPLNEVDEKTVQMLGKNDEIVVYCSSFSCSASVDEVKKLRKMGFRNVKHYAGGIKDWKKAGYPTEKE
jgi:rhodanese-related sulfurtransferase